MISFTFEIALVVKLIGLVSTIGKAVFGVVVVVAIPSLLEISGDYSKQVKTT
jgi:hypothetical protein